MPLYSDIDVLVHEVGPRDGLQATDIMMSTAGKIAWIKALKNAGVRKIQVGSFVPRKLLPQMADSAEIVKATKEMGGVHVAALVPNFKGAQNAMAAGADTLNFVMSASEPHNLNNVRKTHEQSLMEFEKIVELRNSEAQYSHVTISGGLATSFGCTIAGDVDPKVVLSLAEQYVRLGADRMGMADTVGYGNPQQVKELFSEFIQIADGRDVSAHFHDTRGLGLANVFAALEAGVREFDGCLGGLGGCPYAPGATGNVVTEDLVFMLESMGYRTDIDLQKLLAARAVMEEHLQGEPTHGTFVKAGPPKGFSQVQTSAGAG